MSNVIANCVFCGLPLSFVIPPEAGDALTDEINLDNLNDFPMWRDFELIDNTGSTTCLGAGAQHEQAVGIGQTAHHALPGKPVG
jgi:hypothetical protein